MLQARKRSTLRSEPAGKQDTQSSAFCSLRSLTAYISCTTGSLNTCQLLSYQRNSHLFLHHNPTTWLCWARYSKWLMSGTLLLWAFLEAVSRMNQKCWGFHFATLLCTWPRGWSDRGALTFKAKPHRTCGLLFCLLDPPAGSTEVPTHPQEHIPRPQWQGAKPIACGAFSYT